MRTLFLHVGFHKTASTSFQQTCLHNESFLEKNNILFSGFKKNLNNSHINANHGNLIRLALSDNLSNKQIENYFVKSKKENSLNPKQEISLMKQQLEEMTSQNTNLLISAELVSTLRLKDIRTVKAYFEAKNYRVRPFALVRTPLEAAISGLQEQIKGGKHIPYIQFEADDKMVTNLKKLIVPTKHECINNLNIAFEGSVEYFPFHQACQHSYGPVGFMMENCIDLNQKAFEQIDFIRSNESRSDLWTRLQNELNRIQPPYQREQKKLSKNFEYIRLKNASKLEKGREKFNLTNFEYELIKDIVIDSEEKIKSLLGPEFIKLGHKFKSQTNTPVSEIIAYLTRSMSKPNTKNIDQKV